MTFFFCFAMNQEVSLISILRLCCGSATKISDPSMVYMCM